MAELKAAPDLRKRWLRRLLLLAVGLLLAGLVLCLVLYRYLAVYEVTRPEITMDLLMETTSREEWLAQAELNVDFEVTEFEDARSLYRDYEQSIPKNTELSYTANKSQTSRNRAVFTVRQGAANLCSVELVPGEHRYAFGRHDWVPGRVSTGDLTQQLRSATVKLTCLAGEEFTLNDLHVSEEYLSREKVEIKNLTPLEKRFDPVPCFVEYTVGPLYGEIKVADAQGQELSPVEEKGDVALYDLSPKGNGSLTITAPADVKVTVSNALLEKKDAKTIDYDLFEGWDKETAGGAYKTATYAFEGLYSTPVVEAVDASGKALEPIQAGDGVYAFFYPSDKEDTEELRKAAEAYFENYMLYTFSPFEMTYYFNLLQKTVYNSELFLYIAQSQAAMMWAANVEPEYRLLEYDNFHRVSDNCFVCTVQYDVDLTATTWTDEVNYSLQNAYELMFVNRGNGWLAAEMKAITA